MEGAWRRLARMARPGTWLYRDAHYLVVDVAIDPERARRWVPSPLRLVEPATASLFTAFFPSTSFGSVYREVGLLLHVACFGKRGVFSPWMLVDDDTALVLGRELLGYPKKLGDIWFEREGDAIRTRASRRGAPLVRLEGTLGARLTEPPPMLGRWHFNVRSSLGAALPKIVAFAPREEHVEARAADLELEVRAAERDPIAELGFGRVGAARLHRVNLGAGLPPIPIAPVSPVWLARHTLLRTH